MKVHLRTYALAALAAASFGLRAELAEMPASPKKEKAPRATEGDKFTKLDTDGSGGISASEFTAEIDALAAQAGEDLEKAAKAASKKEKMLLTFAEKDKDGDGVISPDEFKAKKPKEEKAPKAKVEPAPGLVP